MTHTTVLFEQDLERIKGSDAAARDQIVTASARRLKILANRMFGRFPHVAHDAQSDDLLQQSVVRLRQATERTAVNSHREMLVTAAQQIRSELLEMAQHVSAPLSLHAASNGTVISTTKPEARTQSCGRADTTSTPENLATWTTFHSSIEQLPEMERQTFDLIWYQELTQRDTAKLMEITERQLRRNWISARLKLHSLLCSFQLPELE